MQSTDDYYKSLVKSIRDSLINDTIDSLKSSDFSPYDKELNWAERKIPILKLKKNFINWSKDALRGLDSFPYMYVMNGNTESLIALFNRTTNLSWRQGDYSYYKHWHTLENKSFNELTSPASVDDLVVTWPGYNYGNKEELDFALSCNAKRLHLDCAYLGLTKPDSIDTSIFETVAVSFSKPFSVPYNRIGVLFTKNKILNYDFLNDIGYVNLGGVHIVNSLMKQLPLDYWWSNYSEKYKTMCAKNNLTPTDCLLFAYDSKGNRIGTACYWQEYLL